MDKRLVGTETKNGQLEFPDIFRDLLKKRGISQQDEVNSFLFPKLADLPSPAGMKNLTPAADLVGAYLKDELQIVIWGDYDVDGTTGTALLVNFFKKLDVEVLWHIPNRLTEGYGLNHGWFKENISQFSSKRFLLITVDCGISNSREIAEIQKLGGDVIVTDHHSIPKDDLPGCLVLNPEQEGCSFQKDKLSGVGVAFYLAAGIRKFVLDMLPKKQIADKLNLKQFLAFVALGTVADMVDVTQTNRILIRGGLEVIGNTDFLGLEMFLESCGAAGGAITSEDIGYLLGPKINAAGRLGRSLEVVQLFTEEDHAAARKRIKNLEQLNKKRKEICEDDFFSASEVVDKTMVLEKGCCVVSGAYHLGVAGIVASRLVEEFGVPAFVLVEDKDSEGRMFYKGSARSIEGVDLMLTLNECSEYLYKYGGHTMAAGLTIQEEKLELATSAIVKSIGDQLSQRVAVKKKKYDIECSVDQVMDRSMLELLQLMEPFGPCNPQPYFRDKSAKIISSKAIGRELEHLNITIRGKYSNYRGIGFGLGGEISSVQQEPERDMVFTPTKNRFRGTVSWQVRVLTL